MAGADAVAAAGLNLGLVAVTASDFAAAERMFRVAAEPDHPEARVAWAINLAGALVLKGAHAEAKRYYHLVIDSAHPPQQGWLACLRAPPRAVPDWCAGFSGRGGVSIVRPDVESVTAVRGQWPHQVVASIPAMVVASRVCSRHAIRPDRSWWNAPTSMVMCSQSS